METVAAGILAFVFFMYVMREVFAWYFKTNKLIEQNDEIIYWLKSLKKHQND